MKTVRIQRKRKSFATQCINFARFLTLTSSLVLKPYINEQKTVIEEARLENLRLNAQVAEDRKQKLSNDVVLGDLKIEEQKMKLQLLQAELKRRGVGAGEFAPPSNYEV